MNRTITIGLIALLLLGAAGFGVLQQLDIQRLRTELAALDKERADLRKRLWNAERRAREPIAAASAPADAPADESGTVASAATPAPGGRRGDFRRNFNEMAGRMTAALDTPELQRLMAVQQKGMLDARYADLFRDLKLNPEQLDKFKSLLVERQTAVMDVMTAAREQGLNPFENRDEIRQLMQTAQNDIDASIRSTLGESVYQQYKDYENTSSQRSLVRQLEQRLSYSSTPLSDAQAGQLVQILARSSPAAGAGGTTGTFAVASTNAVFVGDGPGGGARAAFRPQVMIGGTGYGNVTITDDSIAQASGVLNAQQVAALQQLQAEQQAQAQIGEQLRATAGFVRGQAAAPAQPPGG